MNEPDHLLNLLDMFRVLEALLGDDDDEVSPASATERGGGDP